MNRKLGNIAICLCLVLLPHFSQHSHASNFTSLSPAEAPLYPEVYDPELFPQIQSISDLVGYIQQHFKGKKNSNEFVNYIAFTISRRFYHGYSYYSGKDNWIADLAGKFVWSHLSAIVVPDDILKHPHAACSQQSIVLMACAKYFGMDYRKVSFNHHYAMEIKVNGEWHYVDPNVEVIPLKGSVNELMNDGDLYSLYSAKMKGVNVNELLGRPQQGIVNEYPAVKTACFQKIAYFFSHYFILFVFVLELFLFFRLYKNELFPIL